MGEIVFRYRVEARTSGDYTEAAGAWEVLYLGRDSSEALNESHRAVKAGQQVRIGVEVARG